jgi:hypothetical protein
VLVFYVGYILDNKNTLCNGCTTSRIILGQMKFSYTRAKVLCDVVPVDACHILLCKPMRFDRRTFHDGFKNTYSFVKDGTKITLTPLRMLTPPKPSKG